MAIDTTNEKLAIMEFGQVFEPGLPMAPGVIDQADQQQFLWGYPGVLWGAPATDTVVSAEWFVDARGVEWVMGGR